MAGLSQEKKRMYLEEIEELEKILENEEDKLRSIRRPQSFGQ
ncbi:ECU07_0862 [Encephalitozoon cuniculi GB-M1]|uniref:ECU07_0862 protein n=1 Tax=Encephalitozoon cuniculi (strain GB-M1) TaxID=284813 RepID=A0A1T5PCT8_ENCCU|nr:uncharacterized protein ECU07_0862 [Encephalitozoon cuniculi GB-M1]SKD10687.1 ECU07_0862 [Encephalitozoon cuniculi GB-M1]